MIFVQIRQKLTWRTSGTLRKFLADVGKNGAFGALWVSLGEANKH